MTTSTLRRALESTLLSFAWDEWSQMGVLSADHSESLWAQDPEALLVFSLELARSDPRLFDELLDWLATNERLISVRRLRSLAVGRISRSLLDATLAWVSGQRTTGSRVSEAEPFDVDRLERLFLDGHFPIRHPDVAFAAAGWLRPAAARSGKTRDLDVDARINFAFRTRLLLGVGARAEVVRFLLTTPEPWSTARAIAESAGFAKRNVHDALADLVRAGVVGMTAVGNQQRYTTTPDAWACLLDLDAFPKYREWIPLFAALREVLRWLREADGVERSDYMLASDVLDLLDRVRPDFEYVGIAVPRGATADDAIRDLTQALNAALVLLKHPVDLGAFEEPPATVSAAPQGSSGS